MLWLLREHKIVIQVARTAITPSCQTWLEEDLPSDGDFKESPTMSAPKGPPFSVLITLAVKMA